MSSVIASGNSAWSYGGAILTFAFPMLLFIGVAVGLYLWYTKPEVVPGHRTWIAERPVSYTAMPGTPTATEVPGKPAPAPGNPAADDSTKAAEGENAAPEAQE
ncbi:hypothetical protein EAS64_29580 [Trebonia kvetii]|uniref:Uncharacterized protein n=1 Tax=Trebonia kvetii TaxID=2480626 RepID=A0A6P2BRJ9_9ACTN|nr:hypothetical protein [Trebonia kvetii]TVZ01634.1 hypothetical protein EAS64_29580 [Trebonia kvetii]